MMTVTDPSSRIDRLADQLTAAGRLVDQSWRATLHKVPRHLFVPAVGWAVPGRDDAGLGYRIDRDTDPAQWWDTVYSDASITTQRDDGASDPGESGDSASSSTSAPGVVFPFLELLAPGDGDHIMEIGTGTGWTAGLLASRIGQNNLTSIEIDPQVAGQAAANLKAAGLAPHLIVADAATAQASGNLFDRVHVTCGVTQVPYAWVEQTRPGGVIVLPWMPGGHLGHKVKLTVHHDGTAAGSFHGRAAYMLLRSQRPGGPLWNPHHAEQADVTTTKLDPRDVAGGGQGAELAITAAIPGITMLAKPDDDGSLSLLLSDTGSGSWAACDSADPGRHQVTQYGDRRLWDETEFAYRRWQAWGCPGPEAFQLTVTPEGQTVKRSSLPRP